MKKSPKSRKSEANMPASEESLSSFHVRHLSAEDQTLWKERMARARESQEKAVLRGLRYGQIAGALDSFHDPLEDDPQFGHIIRQALERAKIVYSPRGDWPRCHVIWETAKEILRKERGIVWFSPAEMNPGSLFD